MAVVPINSRPVTKGIGALNANIVLGGLSPLPYPTVFVDILTAIQQRIIQTTIFSDYNCIITVFEEPAIPTYPFCLIIPQAFRLAENKFTGGGRLATTYPGGCKIRFIAKANVDTTPSKTLMLTLQDFSINVLMQYSMICEYLTGFFPAYIDNRLMTTEPLIVADVTSPSPYASNSSVVYIDIFVAFEFIMDLTFPQPFGAVGVPM